MDKNKYYIGLDPSFTGSGIAIINNTTKTITFDEVSTTIDKKSTVKKFNGITDITQKISNKLMLPKSELYIGQEVTTAYSGWFGFELYALDYSIWNYVSTGYTNIKEYSLYSQTYLTKVTGHSSSKKDLTIFQIEDQILPIMEAYGYKVVKKVTAMTPTGEKQGRNNIKRETITNNSADAFIYALRTLLKNESATLPVCMVADIHNIIPNIIEDGKELK